MLFTLLYEFFLWIFALIALPKMLYAYWKQGKYRQSLANRFGFSFPVIQKKGRFLVWVHAVSVGETKAIAQLVKKMKSEMPSAIFVISSVTETGHNEALRSIPMADYHVYLPFDFNLIVGHMVKKVVPDLVIISESDFWHNFLRNCKQVGAYIAVVNGKISSRSLHRFKKFSFFTKNLFQYIDLFCLQNSHYLKRFEQLGIPKEKLVVTGNLKFDDVYPKLTDEQFVAWRKQLKINEGDPVLVVGSTHEPEEKLILEQLQKVWKEFPKLKVLIVPRHPERFNVVAELLYKEKIAYACFSQLDSITPETKVILIDAMGLLRKCYQLATLAVVGGSFTEKVGGHNILEPCWYGVPVLFGPYMFSQPQLVELIHLYHAGVQVHLSSLGTTINMLLSDVEEKKALGFAGLAMVEEIKGATDKTWSILKAKC
jgi:3-deoxy-D-manno-octulosonic-acid transferase